MIAGLLLASVALPCPAIAAQTCSSGLPVQSRVVPKLSGRVVFQGSNAAATDTELYLFDFAANKQVQISQPSWNVLTPIDAQFSPDGKRIAFTGMRNKRLDVYVWTIGGGVPVDLTINQLGAQRSEDPRWSPDGQQLVVKQNYNIRILSLAFSATGVPSIQGFTSLTINGVMGTSTEASSPFFSADDKYVYFVRGTGAGQTIHVITLATGLETAFSANGTYAYYPIVRDLTTVLYAGWTAATGRNDQVLLQAPIILGPNTVLQPSLNDCGSDNSDPATVDSDYILFSNDGAAVSSNRIYRPVLGALAKAQVWPLSRIGLGAGIGGAILGMDYTAAR